MGMRLDRHNLQHLAMGAAVFSAGGGSFPYIEHLSAVRMLGDGAVELVSVEEFADAARVAMVAMVGAPLTLTERLVDADHFVKPVRALEQLCGKRFDAIMGCEIGSMNAIIPVMVAAALGLPLLDGDSLGRSFPEVHMSSLALAGVDMTPVVISDLRGNEIVIRQAMDGRWVEAILRPITTVFGSVAAMANPVTAGTIKRHAILGTYSRAARIGQIIHDAQSAGDDPIDRLVAAEGGVELCRGRVVDVERRTTGGFVAGTAAIAATGGGPAVSVDFQNEYTVVRRGEAVIASVPDILCIFNVVHGEPVGTEALRYAQQVAVLRLPAMAEHLTEQALAVVGPRGFGYDFDYFSPVRLEVSAP